MITSIPGFRDEDIAHLSQGQRQKLLDERKGGKKAIAEHRRAREYDASERERMANESERDEDKVLLDAEQIIARRTAERKLAETRAAEQQEVNARVNAEKEAFDQNENLQGREVVPTHVREHVADAATDLVEQRTEQAREIGLTETTTFIGHPDASEGQAAAAQANSEKEVADREQSANYSAEAPYQGATGNKVVGIQNAQFDDDGNLIEDPNAKNDAEIAARTGAENNGQADQTSEPNASELALEGLASEPSPKRRGRTPRAVGDGPVSE